VPVLYLFTPLLISIIHKKGKKETLPKTSQPQTAVIETVVEQTTTPETEQETLTRKHGTIVCECGARFPSYTIFYRHQSSTGHRATIEEDIEEEQPPITTDKEETSKAIENLENVEEDIKLIAKQTEREKQKAELLRTKIVVTGLTQINNDVAKGKSSVVPSKDLLTKDGPETIYITIEKKKNTATQQTQEKEKEELVY
jgi:uncharacterized Zn finger protein (UPF0148 family)